jgi:anti-anti-sigma factor
MVYGLSISDSEQIDDANAVRLVGDLDHATVATFERRVDTLVASGAQRVLLDLSAVGFVDSSGLSAVVELFHRLKLSGGRLVIVCPDGGPRRIFERTGLAAFLGLWKTKGEALSALRA